MVVFLRFEDDARAWEFERYLKSGSGRAFAKKHFWPDPVAVEVGTR
jgi:hypothetical protein